MALWAPFPDFAQLTGGW